MVQIILAQFRGQQSAHKGGLTTALSANECRHALVAVQHIHLAPMRHSRSQPYNKVVKLLGGNARNTGKQFGHMVLAIPFWQIV